MPNHRVPRGLPVAAAAALTLALLTALMTPPAAALPEDRDQPIHITADRAIRNEKEGITIYSGNVQMRQGSLEVDADNLVVFHEREDANKIVARGEPAVLRQQPEPGEGLVRAYGRVITYYRDKEQVNLRKDARIERDDGSLVTGDSIDYFIAKQLVTAQSNTSETGNKVFVVIPPSLHQAGDDDQAGEDAGEAATDDKDAAPTSAPAGQEEATTITGAAPERSASTGEGNGSEAGNGATHSE